MEAIQDNNRVLLQLSNEEALVLGDWLFRFNENDNLSVFEDQAEERVLWDLEGVLEKTMSEIFSKDYTELLSKAREKIRDKE